MQQERRLAEEGLRRELLTCRRIQAELLPHEPLETRSFSGGGLSFPRARWAGTSSTTSPFPRASWPFSGGDVSGKGIAAALLMANVQATLRGAIPLAWDLAAFAARLDEDLLARTPPRSTSRYSSASWIPRTACSAT